MISLQRSMHSSQMYTPGPAMSFLTCFWLLPQNEHFSRSPPSPMRATRSPSSGGSLLFARQRPTDPKTIQRHSGSRCQRLPPSSRQASQSVTEKSGPGRCGFDRRARLATFEYLVHQTVLDGHRGGEDLVPLDVLLDLFHVAVRVQRDRVLQPGTHSEHLVRLDLDV